MAQTGFKGISFPFRFNGKGGVATSTTTADDFSHIKEGLQQIIGTAIGERVFEVNFGSDVKKFNFQNQDDPIEISRLKFYIEDAVKKWDNRVELISVTITPMSTEEGEGYTLVDIDFHVKKYMKDDSVTIKIR
jgi:phage baseplate assembly protein W